ncbi:hypothetical protein BC831DRAFT_34525 [Entophlyctis helioformis]|nr:hypothetical protein BC831DRAFT_34525 [Entophlyctis helioformis]
MPATTASFSDITLTNLDTGAKFPATELYAAGKPILLLVVRRPGCVLCRHEAGELLAFRETIERCGIQLVAVVKEALGTEEFRAKYWKNLPIYLDQDKAALLPSFWSSVSRAKTDGYEGNLEGEGFILGGLLVAKPDGAISYMHPESSWGDHAPILEVLEACKNLAPADVKAAIEKEGFDLTKLRKPLSPEEDVCEM